jgi:hypothetical protein
MQLPSEILDNLNLSVSRHKHPESLDWIQVGESWTAREGDQVFTVVHSERFGYVIAETKATSYGIGAGIE